MVSAVLAVLALSAATAGAAQAYDWATAESSTYVLSGTSSKSTSGTASITMSARLLGLNTEVTCNASTTAGSIVAGGGGSETINLSGCTVARPANCQASGSLEAKAELVQVGGTTYEKFVPAKGETFGVLDFSGQKCVFNELEAELGGAFAGLPPQSELTVNRQLTLSTAVNTTVGAQLKLGGQPATIAGNITEHLSGAAAGSSWRSTWEGTHGGWEIHETHAETLTTSETVHFGGAPMELKFNYSGTTIAISCSEASAKEASLVPGGTETVNHLALTGCTVTSPSNCSLEQGKVEFEPLTGTLSSVGGSYYETFKPTYGGPLSVLRFTGASCSLAGTEYPVTGSFAGLGSGYGSPAVSQPLVFSQASDEAAGAKLSMGGFSVGWLSGTVSQYLTGSRAGRPWEVL